MTVNFEGVGPVIFLPSEYPSDTLVVTALKKKDKNSVYLDWADCSLSSTKTFEKMHLKAAAQHGLCLLAAGLEKHMSEVVLAAASPSAAAEIATPRTLQDYLCIEMQPKRRVLARVALDAERFMLAPITPSVQLVETDANCFIKTDIVQGAPMNALLCCHVSSNPVSLTSPWKPLWNLFG